MYGLNFAVSLTGLPSKSEKPDENWKPGKRSDDTLYVKVGVVRPRID